MAQVFALTENEVRKIENELEGIKRRLQDFRNDLDGTHVKDFDLAAVLIRSDALVASIDKKIKRITSALPPIPDDVATEVIGNRVDVKDTEKLNLQEKKAVAAYEESSFVSSMKRLARKIVP